MTPWQVLVGTLAIRHVYHDESKRNITKYSQTRKEQTRDKLYSAVVDNPGKTTVQLGEMTNLSPSTARLALNGMEENREIYSEIVTGGSGRVKRLWYVVA